jgi:hypothetical protein
MTAQPTGSLDPWCRDGSECKPEWDADKMGHEHPLEFMAELLQQWPTGAPTVDLEDEERHLRFIQIVAGYPEIGRGMYPLDWPTHPMSVKALQLSLFLDSLPVPEELIEKPSIKAHSVRSAILALDARKYEYGKKGELEKDQLGALHKTCLTLLFKVIRVYVNRESNIDEIDDENNEKSASHYEHLFLNNLHSSQKKRREKWWCDSKSMKNIKLNLVVSEKVNRVQHTHQIKFCSIQHWIEEWSTVNSKNYPYVQNTRHNLLIGASVMLECLFAKIRQYIITEYRPGCVIIDGGGRIEFLTKNDDVEGEMKRVIENSFLLSKKPHPFQDIIERTLRDYGDGRINKPQFPSIEWHTDTNPPRPKRAAYERFIGEKRTIEFFPPIKLTGVNLYAKTEKNQFDCSLCSNECDSPESISKSVKERQFEIQEVCFPHALMFRIGEAQQRRDSSIRRKGKSIPESVGYHSCTFLDLNALGSMFGTPISKTPKILEQILHFHQPPKKDGISEEHLEVLKQSRQNNIGMQKKVRQMLQKNSLNTQSILDEEDDENFKLYKLETQEQLSILKARKSFRFNSKWWSSISQIVDTDSKHFGEIGAWVAAGDDLLLVRRGVIGEEDETLQQQLKELDKLLKLEFPNSYIRFSFCAGLTKRKSSNVEGQKWEKIPDMIQRARKKEKLTKNYWKTRADKSDRDDLISEYDSISGSIKRKEGWDLMSEWVPGNGPVYSIPSVDEGVPTEEESMIYASMFREEEE